ncbi:unnamed protein product [Gordionus sp. m RMFG-2023]
MDQHEVSTPRPLQIISVHDVHKFELNEELLKTILFNEKVKNKKVVVVSIAGAFRKGKSFLLNLFLKYLNISPQNASTGKWLDDKSHEPLTGFLWRGGSERETTGILMWSEPFIRKLPNGEEVVILLMDTQGAFDSQSTVKDCATVFALSTMLSSVQLFNLIQNIQEDDLQHLQLFSEYGRLAFEDYTNKPFQHLMFLIRDWSYPYEYPFGLSGGIKLLDKRLEIQDNQHSELQQIRAHIRTCFEKLDCFLLPHPGLNVATSPQFDGKIKDIQPDFTELMKILAPLIFAPENLMIKEINGIKITGKELFEYFKAYIKIYQGDELPEPKTMLLATAEANNLTALTNSKDRYSQLMDIVCGSDRPYVNPALVEREDAIDRRKALLLFRGTKKMGGPEFSRHFEERLQTELKDMYNNYRRNNEAKNLFSAGKTPIVLATLLSVCYLLSSILGIVGLTGLGKLVGYASGIFLILLVVWIYSRLYGGIGLSEVATAIDAMANIIWQTVFCEWFTMVMQHPTINSTFYLPNPLQNSTIHSSSSTSNQPSKTSTHDHSHKNFSSTSKSEAKPSQIKHRNPNSNTKKQTNRNSIN